MDLLTALARAGGAARSADLERAGVGRSALVAALRDGTVLHPTRGLWVLPGCPAPALARAATGMAHGSALSCHTAALAHGLTVLDPDPRPHLQLARGTTRSWPGVVVHRRGHGRGSLDLVETLLSTARCASLRTTVSLVDQVLAAGSGDPVALGRAGVRSDVRWRRALLLADGRAGSALESFARVDLVLAFEPLGVGVEPQVRLRGVERVDLLVDGWLVVETDGFAFHADRASYREDRRRNAALSRNGYVWLRFTYEDVVGRPDQMVAETLETWARGRPPWWADLRQG